ncbi:atrial natriuretic peptide receptor 1-like [Pundamilia nyererei]|uniref:Atrial natriuretic peptide receptor 1-like n=1 Tax=Pundamilia nyererei TaxID=303518 RepID=A0A9Y6JI08_9CICH|nr:PREDICTED: atrial natriuretic peptide receptor 1-like [Pundamilia nyererei]
MLLTLADCAAKVLGQVPVSTVEAQQELQSVKILTYREPQNPEYQEFVQNLKADAKDMFNYTIEDSLMNIIAGGFYDGLMLYAHALNESMLASNERPNGKDVTPRMWNRTFPGVTGLLHLDDSGDRETDFALWDIVDTNSTTFQIAMVYSTTEEHLTAIPGTHLYWLGGAPPPDFPVCGFKNDNQVCLAKTITIYQMVSIVVIFFFILILTIAIFIYRRMKLEKELVAQLWRISWDDIQMSDLNKVLRSGSKLTLSLRGSNYGSLMTGDGNLQIFAKTGYHKVSSSSASSPSSSSASSPSSSSSTSSPSSSSSPPSTSSPSSSSSPSSPPRFDLKLSS